MLSRVGVEMDKSCQCEHCKVAIHMSDCAVYNEPDEPMGACDCETQMKNFSGSNQMHVYVKDNEGVETEVKLVPCSKIRNKNDYDAMLRENGKRLERALSKNLIDHSRPLKFSDFKSLTHYGDLRLLDSDSGLSQEVQEVGDAVFLLEKSEVGFTVCSFVLIEG